MALETDVRKILALCLFLGLGACESPRMIQGAADYYSYGWLEDVHYVPEMVKVTTWRFE